MENSKSKQCVSFQLHTVLSVVIQSRGVAPSSQDSDRPFVLWIHSEYPPHPLLPWNLAEQISSHRTNACVQLTPKHSSDAGSSDMQPKAEKHFI